LHFPDLKFNFLVSSNKLVRIWIYFARNSAVKVYPIYLIKSSIILIFD